MKQKRKHLHLHPSGTNDRGWTFLETLMVLAILTVLSGGVSYAGLRGLEQARVVAARNTLAAVALALESYRLDTGSYPEREQGLAVLLLPPGSGPAADRWQGPYLQGGAPADPWGNPIGYEPLKGQTFRLISCGADGLPGGEGRNGDILYPPGGRETP